MVRRPLALVLATGVGTVSLVGCTLLLVSTDGLTGGATDDGATSTIRGEGGDTGSSPVADAASIPDGGSDAIGDAATDGDTSIGFCAANPGHTFCDDFDESSNVAAKWTTTNLQGRGTVSSDTSLFRSPPRCYTSATPTGTSAIAYANLARDVGSTDHLRLAFDAQVTAPSGPVGDSFATMSFSQGYLDVLWYASGEVRITERNNGSPNLDHIASGALPPGSWKRLQIDSTPGHIVLTIDGALVFDAATTHPYSGLATITLGLYSQDAESIAFHYDNVLVDTSF